MPVLMDHVIEGNVQDGNKIDFAKEKLAVRAFVKEKEVGLANIDSAGHFKVSFASEEERPITELRVAPMEIGEGAPITALSEKLEPKEFSVKENLVTAQKDLHISTAVLEAIRIFGQRYHMFGQVFAQTTFTIEPAPALKMDFYECDLRLFRPPFFPMQLPFGPPLQTGLLPLFPFPLMREKYLGTAYTDPNGNYDFNFVWNLLRPVPPWLQPDPQPDILVRISQFDGVAWQEIFRGPVDWNIQTSFHRDFLVPATTLRPGPGTAPATGFAFNSIGLIPIDSKHLIKGYAFTDNNDPEPVKNMTKRPFADTLRIGGLFAKTPAVATYKVQVAPTDENHVPGVGPALTWDDVLDPLNNLQWNPINHMWDHKVLGPDPAGHFKNVENEPNWFEPMLKFTFNSRKLLDGFYAFRILGFDPSGNQVGSPVEMPVLCIDNSIPLAELMALAAGKCGGVTLDLQPDSTRTLDLKVTAFDQAGHLLDFGIRATRGSQPLNNDVVLTAISPAIFMPVPGVGVQNQMERVAVSPLPALLADCPMVTYNFELWVQGSATNGYTSRLSSQYTRTDVDLIVAEP